jgi:hypothetical protein
MPDRDISLARRIADDQVSVDSPELAQRPPEERARILDLAFETLDFERLSGAKRGPAPSTRLRELMLARTKVDGPPPPEVPMPAVRPDEGHGSARLSVGGGTTAGNGFQDIRFRGAYHDLIDPTPGYSRGAQIEFGNIVVRREKGSRFSRNSRSSTSRPSARAPGCPGRRPGGWTSGSSDHAVPIRSVPCFSRSRAEPVWRSIWLPTCGGTALQKPEPTIPRIRPRARVLVPAAEPVCC